MILTPDYRLRPEHEFAEMVDDVRSFWRWIENGESQKMLHKFHPELDLDMNNLLVGGESAGGYLTVQTAQLKLTSLSIKCLFVQYPAVDLAACIKKPEPGAEELPGAWLTTYPYSIVEEHLAALAPNTICTRAKFSSRMPLHFASLQANKFVDLSGDNAWLDPMSSLDTAGKLPPMLVYQSKEDEAVSEYPCEWKTLTNYANSSLGSTPIAGWPRLKNSSQMYLSILPGRLGAMFLTAIIQWRRHG